MIYTQYNLIYGESLENTIDLTYLVTGFDAGLPSLDIDTSEKLSNGYINSKTNFLSGRKIKVKMQFVGWNLALRLEILKVAALPSYIPKLIKRTQKINGVDFTDQILCDIQIDNGEKAWTGYAGSDASMTLVCEKSFFEALTITDNENIITSNSETITINNNGFENYAIYEFTINESYNGLDLKLANDHGFNIDYTFTAGDVLVVEMDDSEVITYLNGTQIFNILSQSSAPFKILSGANVFIYSGPKCDLNISYYETRL